MTESPWRVDVHHHFLPPRFVETLKRRGLEQTAGAPLPEWSAERSLGIMNANKIEKAILSVGSPGVYFGDEGEATELASLCNEFGHTLKKEHPERFGYFAQLPMPLVQQSVAEAVHAMEVLDADGVGLLGSSHGVYLGDPRFEPLMAELDRRACTVFVHPDIHPTSEQLGLNIPGFFIEFLVDTTRAVTNLALSGTFERYPNIRWIFSHAGGFVPYIAWRLSLANLIPETSKGIPKGMMTYLKRLYFDTALSPSSFAMGPLKELVDVSHIVYGSDYPYAPAQLAPVQIGALTALKEFTEEERRGIFRENGLALFGDRNV